MLVSGQVEYCNHNNIICTLYIKGIFLCLDVLVGKSLNVYTHEMHVHTKQIFKKKNTVSCKHVNCGVYREQVGICYYQDVWSKTIFVV